MSAIAATVTVCHSAAKPRNPLLVLMLPLLVSTFFIAANLPAQSAKKPRSQNLAAAPYTQLYVFGDSYSDSGSGYIDTNGPTAVVYLAQRLAIPFTFYGDPAYKTQGLNFAISGAPSGANPGRRYPTGEVLGFGMTNQVANFITFFKSGFIPAFNPATTMFFFAGGLNDRGKPDGYTRTGIASEIDTLYAIGARRFMVALLPTKIPQFATAGIAFNPELAKIPAEERAAHPDIRIANSNWGPFMDEVITNPSKYGLTDTTSTCAGRSINHEDTTPCASPEIHFFYHSGHPSTAAHRAVGDLLYQESLTSAP